MPITPLTDISVRGWKIDVTAGSVELIPGVRGPKAVQAGGPLWTVPQWSAVGTGEHETEMQLNVEGRHEQGRYLLHHLSVTAPAGIEVTGSLLRQIAPLRIVRWILPRTFEVDASVLSVWVAQFIAPEMAELQSKSDEPPALVDAATVYRLAEIVREPPAKAVADALGLQARTATNWIARAREQGLL